MTAPLPDWRLPEPLTPCVMSGRFVRLERLAPGHADALHDAFRVDDRIWDYMPAGPFDRAELRDWVVWAARRPIRRFTPSSPRKTGLWGWQAGCGSRRSMGWPRSVI